MGHKRNKLLLFAFCVAVVCGQTDLDTGVQTELDTSVETIPGIPDTVPGPLMPQDGEGNQEKPQENTNDTSYEANPEPLDSDSSLTEPVEKAINRTGRILGRSGQYTAYYAPDYDPMTSDTAPPNTDQRGGGGGAPYTILEARLTEIRKHFMYPYYDKGGDVDSEGDYQKEIQSSTPQVHKNLNFQLPFFGFRFNYTRVSLNGYLEFSDPPPNYDYPLVFPVKEWPKKNDPSFIGIFFSKCRIGKLREGDIDKRKPGVYFRMERDLRERQDRLGVELRERVKWDIREGIIGSETFDPKHMVIVTWKNVSFNGGFANAMYKTNTFQMVLATDEVYTYAMFNYLNIDWTSHTEAGGDTQKGEGGVAAFVGFNAGNGTRSFAYQPYSQGTILRDLTAKGFANGFPGRHYFRIDENILTGTCNKDIDGANLPLMFAPESGNMLGGTVVNITGPCFEPNDQVMCKFDVADPVYGVVVSKTRAICVQPLLLVEGYVRLEIAIGANSYKWKGRYYVESPATATQKIFFKDVSIHEKSPREIRMSWEKYNLTNNDNANIRISLWGYRETTIKPEFLYITDIAENVQNSGEYIIQPTNFKTRQNEFLTDLKYGFLQINLTESIPVKSSSTNNNGQVEITPKIWSRPIPLSWYFQWQWEKLYGPKWVNYLCDDWLRSDRYLKNFAHELQQCPCTLEQALMDKGRFMPDTDCDKDSNPTCYYNNQAVHCVKTGSPTLEGSEQQCCYDKNSYLMLSYDQQWGSSPKRSHNLGLMPYNEATKVPTLSQWYNDIVPKYFCCLWQEEQAVGCETLRFERRPTQDCVAYQAPAIAGVYGDPHIITFDDTEHTHNGKGEYSLVKAYSQTDNLEVQGRFEQVDLNVDGEVMATQLTAVVAQGNSSMVVEVRRRPPEARWRYQLDVIVDKKRVYFDRPSLKFQHFPGVTVYTPTYILNQSEVIMMFDNGAGVEVVDNKGFMTARVYLPWSFINKTRGLFGNWSFNKEDDFTLPDGRVVQLTPSIDNMETLYKEFGQHWMLDDVLDDHKGRSLFNRDFAKSSATYNNKSFVPQFSMDPVKILTPNHTEMIQKTYDVCSTGMYECYYDYAMTFNRDLAHFTQNYKATIYQLKEISRKKVVSCGVLETPRFGRKSSFKFVPGTKVTFDCNKDFVLVGDPRRTCQADGQWDIPEYGYTECLRQQEYSSRQAAITWGIILVVLIPLILIIAFIALRVYQKYVNSDESSAWSYLQKPQKVSRPLTPPDSFEDDDEPGRSDITSSVGPGSKKRRSYDKTYRTHEPLKNRPELEFEDKPWDLNDPENSLNAESPKSPVGSQIYSEPFVANPKPDLVKNNDNDSYAQVLKQKKDRFSSQSSIVTDV